ncbi:MAG: tRNA (guanosine(46)-N7)-methyltransferase TrmB [Burkholderiales bacterium]|nr:tRNA (guanosine(46)-N7)-methyltransferase TrmB [Burkholderiales bacterium]
MSRSVQREGSPLSDDGNPPADPPHRPIRSFVLRQGRLSPAQARALESLLPRFGIDYAPRALEFATAFGRNAPVIVEIGFGMGETTAAVAQAHADRDFLGIEVHAPGVGALLREVAARALTNVRVVRHDAVEVVAHMIPRDALAGVHVWFPDPWPKKRHHKRRLLQPAFVHALATRLAPGGYLHAATDWEEYAQEILATFSAESLLANTAGGFAPRPDWRPQTKFEARGAKLGHGSWDIVFRRR